jgi:probable addiction module antidote protein
MAKVKTTRFDVAEYLDTPERQAEYVSAALETGDAAFVRDAVGVVARPRHAILNTVFRCACGRASC